MLRYIILLVSVPKEWTICIHRSVLNSQSDKRAITIMEEEKDNPRAGSVDGIKIIDGHPQLEIPTVTWWKSPGLRHLYLMMPILFLGSTINGYDGSLLNGLQTMDQWRDYFGDPNGARLGLFTAIQNIGALTALPLSPYAADWFGRRVGVAIGIVLIFVGVIIQSVPATNEGMFIGGRFLVGFGSNFSQGCAPLLIIEVCRTYIVREGLNDLTDRSLPIHSTAALSRQCTTRFGTLVPSSQHGRYTEPSVTAAMRHGGFPSLCRLSCLLSNSLVSGSFLKVHVGCVRKTEEKKQ